MSVHVVFGAGQVGSGLVRALVAQGHTVRVVRRSATPVPGAEGVAGDARDPAFAIEATRGAAVIYHCMNPSAYTGAAWEEEFPRQGEALIAAALAADAKLVCLDNLYGYGITDGRRTEATPMAATGRKGRVRVAWNEKLHGTPGLRFAVGRAGDFFGPGVGDHSLMSPRSLAGLRTGSAPWLVGDTSAPHAFSFVPDVVAGLAALGTSDATGVWHLPVIEVAPAELVARIADALGSSTRARSLPGWAVSTLGHVVPLFGELRETLYQWDRPFLVDDSRFRARFPGLARSLEEAVSLTAADLGVARAAA